MNSVQDTQNQTETQTEEQNEPRGSSLKDKVVNGLKIFLAFILAVIAVYLFLTAPAYYSKIKYLLTKSNQPKVAELVPENKTNSTVLLPEVKKSTSQTAQQTPTNGASAAASNQNLALSDLDNDNLIIPKINIKAPIVWNSPFEEKTMLANLQKGVVHYGFTPLPDSGKGPIFISGHSSYYWWDKGQYKTVFANLDQLENGDEIALAYNNVVYIYRVYEKITVKPEQVDVLNQVDEPILALMTCTPAGTNLRRLIIKAKQISPSRGAQNQTNENKPVVTSPTPMPQPQTTPKVLGPTDRIYFFPWMPWRP
ncbi:MAG: sortase [Patescibacteria group bacterium]|nr:sortase [Patescibacteria group bacterium]